MFEIIIRGAVAVVITMLIPMAIVGIVFFPVCVLTGYEPSLYRPMLGATRRTMLGDLYYISMGLWVIIVVGSFFYFVGWVVTVIFL